MPRVEPLRALHYDPARTGGLEPVLAPPYDVIDPEQRAALAARSPYNAVAIDLPEPAGAQDRYTHAAQLLAAWQAERVLVRDEQPTVWALTQDFTGPDGARRTRSGFLARVRVEAYGAGRIRPHERTHPAPREDRLALMRATRANTSPIFTLYGDPDGIARRALRETTTATPPWAQATTGDGTVNRLWRVTDTHRIRELTETAGAGELLIADGHHRYETARVYAEQLGGEGPHRYVLMCLVALEDDGLVIFPTHRLVRGFAPVRLASALRNQFETRPVQRTKELFPTAAGAADPVRFGVAARAPELRLIASVKDPASVARALPGHSDAYRRLDTAVLEALILKGALGMSDEQIDALDGLGYARDGEQALAGIAPGSFDVAFLMAPTPIATVRAVAAAGEIMPPKSTYFFPKVPTGLVFNPLDG